MQVFLTLLPDALVMALGVLLRRAIPPAGWVAPDRLCYLLLFPALIFRATAASGPGAGRLMVVGAAVWSIMATGFALGWLTRRHGPPRFLDFAGVWQTAWRFNSALALVMAQALPEGARALMSVVVGLAVPFANLLAVGVLSRGNALSGLRTLQRVLLNPFFLASVLGMAAASTGTVLPGPLDATLARLAQAALPLALLSIGAALDVRALAGLGRFQAGLHAIKLGLLPGLTLLAAHLLGAGRDMAAVLVLFAATPTATAAQVLASVFGADRGPVATVIAQSTLLGCVTVPLWLAVLAWH